MLNKSIHHTIVLHKKQYMMKKICFRKIIRYSMQIRVNHAVQIPPTATVIITSLLRMDSDREVKPRKADQRHLFAYLSLKKFNISAYPIVFYMETI